MSTNNQYEMLVFQGAESAIEGVLSDAGAFVAAINTATGDDPPVRSFTLDHDDHSFSMTAGATVAAGVPEVPVGFTLGDFVSYPFTITSSSSIASINSAGLPWGILSAIHLRLPVHRASHQSILQIRMFLRQARLHRICSSRVTTVFNATQ